MKLFQFKGTTRSGCVFRTFYVDPVLVPSVEIPALLMSAIQLDADDAMEHEDAETPGDAPLASNKRTHDEVTPEQTCEAGKVDEPPKKSRRTAYKAKKRKERMDAEGHPPKLACASKHVKADPEGPLHVEAGAETFPSSSCGYRAYDRGPEPERVTLKLTELLDDGCTIVHWDGSCTKPLIDSTTKKTFALLVAPPDDDEYRKACTDAHDLLHSWREKGVFTADELDHKRGAFPAVNIGVSYGQGSQQPGNLKNRDQAMAASILGSTCFKRLAGFSSGVLRSWLPGFYKYAKERLDALFVHMPNLRRNFSNSIYPRAAFNLGDEVCTYVHVDVMNCPFGWCSIQALGSFDHTKGGHLVLPELKLIIEFPSGTLIYIPSAAVRHANTPIQEGESRSSFTQYCPGGLFRYVDNQFKTEAKLKKTNKRLYHEIMAQKATRWAMGLGLWSKLEDIVEPSPTA